MSQKTQSLSDTKVSRTNKSIQTVAACTVPAEFQVRQSFKSAMIGGSQAGSFP